MTSLPTSQWRNTKSHSYNPPAHAMQSLHAKARSASRLASAVAMTNELQFSTRWSKGAQSISHNQQGVARSNVRMARRRDAPACSYSRGYVARCVQTLQATNTTSFILVRSPDVSSRETSNCGYQS
eukprot:2199954-Pyramimonas_sp.AAC.1